MMIKPVAGLLLVLVITSCEHVTPSRPPLLSVCNLSKDFGAYRDKLIAVRGVYLLRPTILIEKRFGIGYTVNFGKRWSWLVMVSMLSPALLALLFLR